MPRNQCSFCGQPDGQHKLKCPNHPAYKNYEVGTIEKKPIGFRDTFQYMVKRTFADCANAIATIIIREVKKNES